MADTYPVRQDPIPLIKTPSLPTTGQIGMKEVLGIQEPYMKEKARLIPEIGAARGAVEEAKQAQQVIGAEGEAAATKGFAAAEKGAMQQYQGKMEKEPLPAFVPSKENAQDLAMLFSLVNVIGFVIGGGGKENAQAAMSAMNGMLEGHQKGRADLYKQELSTFDKNFKSMVQKHSEFRKEMEDAVKLASTDKEGAMADAKLAAAKAGSNITKAMLEQGRLLDAYKFVDESQAGVDKAVTAEAKIRADAAKEVEAERRHRESLAHAERMRALSDAHAEKMARMKGGAGGAPLSGMSPKELFEETAKAIANYAERPPALRDPQRNALLARARQINPAYNEAGYGDRDIAYRNWINPNGAGFKQISAFTTVAGHLETLDKLGVALKNNDTQAINSAYNWFQTATGDPSVTNFNAAKQAVAAETVKAITGTPGALRDREEAAAIFGAVQSPAQLKGAISTVKELINSRLQTSQAMFEAGTGRQNFDELLPPIVKQTFRAGKGAPQAAAPALTGAAAIPTGAAKPSSQQVDIKTYPVIGKTPDGRPVHQAPDGKKYVE
jgi:hypothetical protein